MDTWCFVALFWLVCSVVAFGLTFAYFQDEYPRIAEMDRREDYKTAFICSIFGPFGLIAAIIFCDYAKHGWKIR